jgi:hypothetical protein
MRTQSWHSRTRRATALIIILSLSGLLVAITSVAAVVEVISPGGNGLLSLDGSCADAQFSCGILAGLLISVVPIVVAVLSLLAWRLRRVRGKYRAHAIKDAGQMVEATARAEHVVGREGLCAIIKDNLQDRSDRRPYLIMGGVGVGKTAVLVRLTESLARQGAVPVPIRLRDAEKELDFLALARRRFLRDAEPWFVSEAEGDTIWRKLREEDRIVVLADGLEEALITGASERSRDTAIRLAFAEARDRELPLVVTARPHDALRYVDAALLRLEPLSEGAALKFIYGEGRDDDPNVRLIAERAEVVEAPLYMQLARELHDRGLLAKLDTSDTGRLALRIRLLDRWWKAIVAGELHTQAPYTPVERERALGDLQSLAVIGLIADNLEVPFTALDRCHSAYGAKLRKACSDARQAASVGARLGLVESQSTSIRFRHSIVQAYLGSRRIGELLDTRDFLSAALKDPGQEGLMALVMFCFEAGPGADREQIRSALLARAGKAPRELGRDMFAAAVEIGSLGGGNGTNGLSQPKGLWDVPRDHADRQSMLRAVARIGDLGRPPDERSGTAAVPDQDRVGAYEALWTLCLSESSYPIRLAAAQELGAGGSIAYEVLKSTLTKTLAEAQGATPESEDLKADLRKRSAIQGWILPLLAVSVDAAHVPPVIRLVREWIGLLCRDQANLAVEASWAQGFKYEANRLAQPVDPSLRGFLAGEAEHLLERTKFWYSRVSLLHAFSLWALEGAPATRAEPAGVRRRERRRGQREAEESARRLVRGWAADRSHPFVQEAAELCELALATGTPGRFLWIDEMGVISKLGPREASRTHIGNSRLWISPAAGWLALDERARQLVGEIVVTLNLTELTGVATPEQRIERALGPLPPCLTEAGGRSHLQVAGDKVERGPRPGSTCKHGCRLHLCPYPAPGQTPFRGELSEAFCRDQQRILDRHHRGPAPWQSEQQTEELREFWKHMEERTRI